MKKKGERGSTKSQLQLEEQANPHEHSYYDPATKKVKVKCVLQDAKITSLNRSLTPETLLDDFNPFPGHKVFNKLSKYFNKRTLTVNCMQHMTFKTDNILDELNYL